MGRKNFLIDTNTAIEYIGGALPDKASAFIDSLVDGVYYISVINKMEMLGFASLSKEIEEKFNTFVDAAIVIGIDDDIVDKTIEIRKKHKIKLPDGIIAATAICNELTVITRNIKDFDNIKNVKAINPYTDL